MYKNVSIDDVGRMRNVSPFIDLSSAHNFPSSNTHRANESTVTAYGVGSLALSFSHRASSTAYQTMLLFYHPAKVLLNSHRRGYITKEMEHEDICHLNVAGITFIVYIVHVSIFVVGARYPGAIHEGRYDLH